MLAQAVPREPAEALTLDAAGLQRFDTSALAVCFESAGASRKPVAAAVAVRNVPPSSRRWPRCTAWTACSSAHPWHRYHDLANRPPG